MSLIRSKAIDKEGAKMKYRVICQKRDQKGNLLKEQIHECINMDEVFGLVDVCCRCGWNVKKIIEIA